MPKIKVDTNKIRGYEDTLNGVLSDMEKSCHVYFYTSRHLDWDIKCTSNINNRLQAVNGQIASEFSAIKKMWTFLDNAKRAYDYVEEHVGDVPEKENLFNKFFKETLKGTPIGAIAVGVHDIASSFKKGFADFYTLKGLKTAAKSGKSALSIGKNVVKIGKAISAAKQTVGANKAVLLAYESTPHQIGRATKAISGGKNEVIKEIFGLNDSLKEKEYAAQLFMRDSKASYGARFAPQFKSSLKEGTSKLGKAAGVAGIVLSGISNAVDNRKEYEEGKISGKRAVAETISETAIDTVKDLAVGAAVTAGLAAAFGCAPVLAVAGITAGITVGADAVCKVITKRKTGEEKKFTEVASDFVLDIGEKAAQGISDGIRDVYQVGSNPVSAVYVGG